MLGVRCSYSLFHRDYFFVVCRIENAEGGQYDWAVDDKPVTTNQRRMTKPEGCSCEIRKIRLSP